MFRIISLLIFSIAAYASNVLATETYKFEMTLCDAFEIAAPDNWNITVDRYLTLRFADIKITPKHGYDFNMKLFFKADTEDLAQFDTPQKIEQSVRSSTEDYLPYIVEKQIKLIPVPLPQSFGYYAVITDAKWEDAQSIPDGEYKYMTRGMYRTSGDTALGFSIMSNDITSDEYKYLLTYVYGFIKNASDQPINPMQKGCGQ
jgi:hypothetical protein